MVKKYKLKAKSKIISVSTEQIELDFGIGAKPDICQDDEIKMSFLKENLRRARSRKKAHSIDITVDELMEIGRKQNWRCAITGDQLEFTRGGTFNNNNSNSRSCSIDRIDTSRGYTLGNVQLVTWQTNSAKAGMTQEEIIQWARRVYNAQRRAQRSS